MGEELFLAGYHDKTQVKLALLEGQIPFSLDESKIPSFEWLLQNVPADNLVDCLKDATGNIIPEDRLTSLRGLLTHQPVWAAGVTYKISEEARERESHGSTVYSRVYFAERPELFWKSIGYAAVSSGDKVGIRADAAWSVPEPELTLVINARKEVIGFTIGNDVSSRDIEGENPLYLPQAKVYQDSCALGPRIWLQSKALSWPQVDIEIRILRANEIVFSGQASTSNLNRKLSELVEYLGHSMDFPYGVFLMTGTGIVPPDEFTLKANDVVSICIEPIGELTNTVHVVGTG